MTSAEAGASGLETVANTILPSQTAAFGRQDDAVGQQCSDMDPAQPPLPNASTDLTDDVDSFPAWPKSSTQKRMQSDVQSKSESPNTTRSYLQTQSKASFASPKTPKRKGQSKPPPCTARAKINATVNYETAKACWPKDSHPLQPCLQAALLIGHPTDSVFAERSRARILRPGELTLAVYGADEALKWECRVLSFLQAVR